MFDSYFKKVGELKHGRGHAVHCMDSPCDPGLVELLGEKWYERILNINKDFSYVTRRTIQFWTHHKTAIKEFIEIGGNLFENHIDNEVVLVFTFVRGDGVKQQYDSRNWK